MAGRLLTCLWFGPLFGRCAAILAFTVLAHTGTLAQSGTPGGQGGTPPLLSNSRPVVGGTAGTAAPPEPKRMIPSADRPDVMRHRDYAGRACLDVGGYARAVAPSSKMMDHVVIVTNRCPQFLKLQVCYYRTQDCVDVQVAGYGKKEAILGTIASQNDFRFEFRERF